jgi:hypothetical protein
MNALEFVWLYNLIFYLLIGAGLSAKVLVVIGFAILSANCVHVGISEYLSSKAHKEFLQAEKRRELWEFKHYKDGEINEVLIAFYTFTTST